MLPRNLLQLLVMISKCIEFVLHKNLVTIAQNCGYSSPVISPDTNSRITSGLSDDFAVVYSF